MPLGSTIMTLTRKPTADVVLLGGSPQPGRRHAPAHAGQVHFRLMALHYVKIAHQAGLTTTLMRQLRADIARLAESQMHPVPQRVQYVGRAT